MAEAPLAWPRGRSCRSTSSPRLGGGRRLGRARPLRPAAHARRRCRTSRAPGRSCSPPTWRSSASAPRTPTACRSRAPTRRAGSPTCRSRAARKNFRAPPKLPCADGTERRRMQAAEHVVLAYRDRAEYEDGRARWRAYQQEVLRARLDHRSDVRAPIEAEYRPPPSFLSEVFDMFNPLDPCPASRRCSTATRGRASGRTAGRSTPRPSARPRPGSGGGGCRTGRGTPQSMPYGRSSGVSTNSTPRALSSS